jgi:hypothetical protein
VFQEFVSCISQEDKDQVIIKSQESELELQDPIFSDQDKLS